VFGIPKFERFFRAAASLDVDKKDLKRHEEFVNRKVLDLLVAAEATAKANGRRVVEPFDLPITKGLQENIDRFLQLDSEVEVTAMLDRITPRPQLELACSQAIDDHLLPIAGGLSVAVARCFRIVDSDLKNPQSKHWQRAFGDLQPAPLAFFGTRAGAAKHRPFCENRSRSW
jgi:hypothetical protein